MKNQFIPFKQNKSQQGFTIVETMTGALISMLFLGLGANLVLVANLQKVVAKKNVAMNTAVQSDMEAIKYQANLLKQDNTKCNPKNANGTDNPSAGYANELKLKLGNSATATQDLKILNTNYTMTRTIDTITEANIIPISYQFTPQGSTTPEYKLYIEMIPNAAFTCPSST
jgi:competence protein ComGC